MTKPDAEKRGITFGFRMTLTEFNALLMLANREQRTPSDVLRRLICEATQPERNPAEGRQ